MGVIFFFSQNKKKEKFAPFPVSIDSESRELFNSFS